MVTALQVSKEELLMNKSDHDEKIFINLRL
jgi:hypothetical protein